MTAPNKSLQPTPGNEFRCAVHVSWPGVAETLIVSPNRTPRMNPEANKPNPILSTALGMIEGVAPGALDDPEKALRDLVPRLRFVVVERLEKPTIPQLEALRAFDTASSLVQIRKALQSGALQFGPFPGELAERALLPELLRQGLSVSLRELTAAEREQQLGGLDGE